MESAQDFTDVYQQTLPSIWHFVSARIPDYDEAQDVTSDVFTRAWQSWPRYDPVRGTPAAWMCGIAQRAIADWWRRRRPERVEWEQAILLEDEPGTHGEPLMDRGDREPEHVMLRKEFATDLKRALLELNARERDGVALRFAAGLSIAEVAAILDLSVGATKMMICRAVKKLRAALAPELASNTLATDERTADFVDEAIADVLAQRPSKLADPLLSHVLQYLAVSQQSPVPPELPNRVKACVECGTQQTELTKGGSDMLSLFARVGMAVVPGLRAATIPACAVCAAAPVLAGPVAAIGLSTAAAFLHNMLWLLLPLNLILLWRSYGRHGDATGLVLATVGVVLILAHLATHVLGIPREMSEMIATTDDVTINDIAQLGSTVIVEVIAIMAAIWVGAVLLIAGSLIDWRAQRRLFFRRRRAYAV